MPERVARYELIDPIGRSAAGVVFKALDTKLKRLVALKVISTGTDVAEEVRARLLAEAQAWSALNHPGIASIHDIGEDGGRPFIVMELPDGPSLHQLLVEGVEFDLQEKVSIMVQLCSALAHAHQRGVVHRDIHPGNVFLPVDGPPKIVDFAVMPAGVPDSSGRDPASDVTRYHAPEQMQERADARSDQYSLAAVFDELLRSRPSGAGTPVQTAADRADGLRGRATLLPELERILERAMSREPAKRFADLRSMRAELELVLERCSTGAHAAGTLAPGPTGASAANAGTNGENRSSLSFPADAATAATTAASAQPDAFATTASARRGRRDPGNQWSRSNVTLYALAAVAAVSLAVALLSPFPDTPKQANSSSREPNAQRPAVAGTTFPAGRSSVATAAAREAASEVPTALDPTGKGAAESARDRALAARFHSAKAEAIGQVPELHLAAQRKELEADAGYARGDYSLAAVLYDMARDGYEIAARQAELQTAAAEKAEVDAQVAADAQANKPDETLPPGSFLLPGLAKPKKMGTPDSAGKQVVRAGPIIIEPPPEKPSKSSLAAFAAVFAQPTDGNRGGGTWGACWRADAASARACAEANCDASRKSGRPCLEVASSRPGQHCAVARAAGLGVSSGACDAGRSQAQAAALAGCREQVTRHYGNVAPTCTIAWSNAQQ